MGRFGFCHVGSLYENKQRAELWECKKDFLPGLIFNLQHVS